jgi:hypothetical protein
MDDDEEEDGGNDDVDGVEDKDVPDPNGFVGLLVLLLLVVFAFVLLLLLFIVPILLPLRPVKVEDIRCTTFEGRLKIDDPEEYTYPVDG